MEKEILVGLEQKQEPMKMHYLLILDKSGSMSSVRDITIKGFNENVQTILSESKKNNQTAYVTLILFNHEIAVIHSHEEVEKLKELTHNDYIPDGMTALNDALGRGIEEVEKNFTEGEQIFITVFTDGEENSSKKYSGEKIADLIKEKQSKGWTIAYIGCEIDIDKLSKKYKISSTNFMSYAAGEDNVRGAYATLNNTMTKMSSRRAMGNYSNTDVFSDDQNQKDS